MSVRKMSGNERRGIKQDRTTRPALIKRNERRRTIEAVDELMGLIERLKQ